jgi:hypothetical protein
MSFCAANLKNIKATFIIWAKILLCLSNPLERKRTTLNTDFPYFTILQVTILEKKNLYGNLNTFFNERKY